MMKGKMKHLQHYFMLAAAGGMMLFMNGCATVTALTESALTPPSISDSVDSFESAALAIKTSNRILLQAPISEQDAWPEKLYKMPTAENTMMMALSGLGARYGVAIPTEVDNETGLPRPTSPLYIMIRDRNQMLDKELRKTYIDYFTSNPKSIQCDIETKQPDTSNEFAYRNALMAYGTVSGNNQELEKLEQQMEQMSLGFKECDAWLRRSQEGEVATAYCKDPALKDESFKTMEIKKTKEQLEADRKVYGKLSKRVYQTSVAGADFSAAAITKIAATIIKFPRALTNAPEEIKGWKGAMNAAMLLPRIKNMISSIGIYKDNLSLQLTAYRTMYGQIKGSYDVEDTPQTKQARERIERFEQQYAALKPKLDQLLSGDSVSFTVAEITAWDQMAAAWPQEVGAMDYIFTAGK